MTDIWLPPKVSREHRDSTRKRSADLREMFYFQTPVCAQWNAELQKLDPYLRLVQAKPGAAYPGVQPGSYYLLRLNPGAPETLIAPLPGEPTSRMLEDLRAMDAQNPRVLQDQTDKLRRQEQAKDRERARDDEERQTELLERWKAATETQVSMADTGWSQNVAGRRGRK